MESPWFCLWPLKRRAGLRAVSIETETALVRGRSIEGVEARAAAAQNFRFAGSWRSNASSMSSVDMRGSSWLPPMAERSTSKAR